MIKQSLSILAKIFSVVKPSSTNVFLVILLSIIICFQGFMPNFYNTKIHFLDFMNSNRYGVNV
ncbi:hypothetical protein M8332_00360 [Fructilactobacillus ixorae]|uniref:ABC transporter permease n=1 Tax=Fructilactobacillus ixorae TaxID=1750535 RepID=A0ABY5C4I6_9LACO|nr:hypothetical protein [Fructilactobacillus ixorae]USS93356.1 hypothetical protein M8332_00360 [Fructilactobacillus ixorae]